MRPIAYYVSGHGYGHARRSAEVMRALLARDPSLLIHVRTSAPAFIFEGLDAERVSHHACEVDPGVVEEGVLAVSAERTGTRLADFMAGADRLIDREVKFVREQRVEFIVSDATFIAGDVARRAGARCVAVTNFTWDWIYEALLPGACSHLLDAIRQSYGNMEALLRLPFGHPAPAFRNVIDVPLVAPRPVGSSGRVLRNIGVEQDDRRPRVLVGMRGGIAPESLAAAARGAPGFLFLYPGELGWSMPGNVLAIRPGPMLPFTDVVTACDVVVSKLGYGIVADCIVAKSRLLWPRRTGFREDALSEADAPRYIPIRELPVEDFHAGKWGKHLEQLMRQPMPEEIARADGAEVCAGLIAGWR